MGPRERSPSYQKFCERVTHIRGNRKGQLNPDVQWTSLTSGKPPWWSRILPSPGKYDFAKSLFHFTEIRLNFACTLQAKNINWTLIQVVFYLLKAHHNPYGASIEITPMFLLKFLFTKVLCDKKVKKQKNNLYFEEVFIKT